VLICTTAARDTGPAYVSLAVCGAISLGSPSTRHVVTVADGLSNLDDLEMVASTDEGSGDAIDMLQDDIEFYDWADRAANAGPTAQG